MPKVPKGKITPKQVKIVKRKVEATIADIPQRVWAPTIYPDADPKSAEVLVSRELNKVNVQEALQIALAEKGLTPERIVSVVDDAMGAERLIQMGEGQSEFMPDHSIRLKAAGMAAQFMGVNKGGEGGNTNVNIVNVVNSDKDKYGI